MIKHQLLAKVNDTVCNAIKRSICLLHCRKIIFLKCSLRICSHLSSWNPSLGWNQRESCLHDSRDPARHFFCISLQTISKPEEERISAAPKSTTKPATCEEEAALGLIRINRGPLQSNIPKSISVPSLSDPVHDKFNCSQQSGHCLGATGYEMVHLWLALLSHCRTACKVTHWFHQMDETTRACLYYSE